MSWQICAEICDRSKKYFFKILWSHKNFYRIPLRSSRCSFSKKSDRKIFILNKIKVIVKNLKVSTTCKDLRFKCNWNISDWVHVVLAINASKCKLATNFPIRSVSNDTDFYTKKQVLFFIPFYLLEFWITNNSSLSSLAKEPEISNQTYLSSQNANTCSESLFWAIIRLKTFEEVII